LFLSSLSFGEKAAPNGLCWSNLVTGGLGLDGGLSFNVLRDGGVDPEENFELKDEIHELRLFSGIGFGALPLGGIFEVACAFCPSGLSLPVSDFASGSVSLSGPLVEGDAAVMVDCSDRDVDPLPAAGFFGFARDC
jgi:hypothetical protein